jgi:hypothetical protein
LTASVRRNTPAGDMSDNGNGQPKQPLLYSFDGAAAPSELGPSLMKVMELAEPLRQSFEQLVLPCMGQAPDEQVDEAITQLCRNNELDVDVAGTAIKATRFFLRQAAALNVSPQQLGEDLTALSCPGELIATLSKVYELALNDLRLEIAQSTIVAHGNVLTGVEWRVDTLGASNRGRGINIPVAMITLHFRNGDETERLTLQALPDAVNTLREVCENLLR